MVAFLVAAAVWLPCLHLFYAVDDGERRTIVLGLTEARLEAWSRPADVASMRGVNPEWDFMNRTFTVLALAEQALEDGATPERRARLLVTIDTILDATLDAERRGDHQFLLPYAKRGAFLDPEGRSVFVDGETLMMIAARQLVSRSRPELADDARRRAERIARMMRRSPSLSAESYPNECWTFCNTTALAALAMHDRASGEDHHDLAKAWVAHARAHLVDPRTGILISSYTWDGKTLDNAEGSSIWMSAQNLLFVDESFARDQWTRARAELGVAFLGFGWAREWPRGAETRPDVDSGPIVPILDASAGSSGLAILGAAAFEDKPFERSLLASLGLAAFPVREGKTLRYRASNAVGDAVVLRALTFGPLLKRMHHTPIAEAQ